MSNEQPQSKDRQISVNVGGPHHWPMDRNEVWVRAEIGIEQGKPTCARLAEVYLSDSDGMAFDGREVAIQFHYGMGSWTLMQDDGKRAIQFERGLLPDIIEKFSALVGITLPEVWILEPGVGRYRAASRFITQDRNYDAGLVQGATYSLEYAPGRERLFVPKTRMGVLEVCFLDDEVNQDGQLRFGLDATTLTLTQWQSIKFVSPSAIADKKPLAEDGPSP